MKILVYSDTHLEFRCRGTSQLLNHGPNLSDYRDKVDCVLLAGDIGVGDQPWVYREAVEDYLNVPVIQIVGNHEYYGQSYFPWKQVLAEHDIQDNQVHIVGGTRILAATLWTDFACMGDVVVGKAHARNVMADYNCVAGFTPDIAEAEHWASRAWLLKALNTPFDGPTVILTHHSPTSAARNVNYPVDLTTAGFCSDACDLINAAANANIKAWVYGHDHWSQIVDKTPFPMISAQMGYPNENTNWNGPVIIEV